MYREGFVALVDKDDLNLPAIVGKDKPPNHVDAKREWHTRSWRNAAVRSRRQHERDARADERPFAGRDDDHLSGLSLSIA